MTTQNNYKLARLMCGQIPEWDESYIERNLPSDLLEKMHAVHTWVDGYGYWWGFSYVCASKLIGSNEPFVRIASKPMGQGFHLLKYWQDGVIKKCTSDDII
jgi:hypothetical protein